MNVAAQPHIHRGPLTIAVMLATLMQVIDMTIANVALPHMQGSFAVTLDQIKWVLTSYIVASAVATPTIGWLASRFGRRNVLLISIIGFTAFSFMVGSSVSIGEVVLARILQGTAAAAFSPLAQAILLDAYPRERHGTAMAILGVGILVGPILGPVLGGFLTQNYNWRWCFFINIPLGLVAFLMVWNFVPRQLNRQARNFDWIGFVLLSLGIGALQFTLDQGGSKNWFASTEIVVAAVVAVVMLWMYPWYASLKRHPFVSLSLFRDRNFSIACIMMLFTGLVLLGTMSLLPPLMQELLHFPVFATGLILAPRGIGAMLMMLLVGRLIQRVNPRLIIISGLLTNVFALFEMSRFTLQVDPFFIIWTGFLQGMALGMIFVPLATVAFSTLPSRLRNEATPIYNLIRNVGASIGISIVFTLLSRNAQINHAALAAKFTVYSERLSFFLHTVPLPRDMALALLNGEITRQSVLIGYNDDFMLMSVLMLLLLPLPFLMHYRYGSEPSSEGSEAAME